MSISARKSAEIKSVDPVWEAVRAGARQIVTAEPSLANMAISAVLNHDTFEQSLAHRLAARLDHDDVSADLIRQAFAEMLVDYPEIGHNARVDLAATLERDPACHRAIEPLLFFKGYQAIQTHRFAHAMLNAGRRDFCALSAEPGQPGVSGRYQSGGPDRQGYHARSWHGPGDRRGRPWSATTSRCCKNVTLGGTGKSEQDRHPKIGNGVLIGAGAKVLGNIIIGDCSRIGAGSVVLKEVPPRVTVAGVPAKVIGEAGCAQPALVMDQMVLVHDLAGDRS